MRERVSKSGSEYIKKVVRRMNDHITDHITESDNEITLRDFLAAACRRDYDVQFVALFSNDWAASLCYNRADAMLNIRKQPIKS